jgi:hypothetical protein
VGNVSALSAALSVTTSTTGATVTSNETASTVMGQNIYIVGSIAALGSWNKDGSGNVLWESGANRTDTTPASGSATLNGTWKEKGRWRAREARAPRRVFSKKRGGVTSLVDVYK